MKFVEHKAQPSQNVLLYGPPKSGKTTGALSAPGPLGLVNADLPNATWYARGKYPEVQEIEWEGFSTLIELGALLKQGELPFKTLVIDPVGELYRMMLEEFSDRAISPSLPTYLAVQTHIERFCRAMCESPDVNLVIVAHDIPVKDEGADETERLPATGTTNPALGRKLMSMVDVVGFTGVVEKEGGDSEYVAQLINGKGRRGGDRTDSLGKTRPIDLAEWFTTMAAAMAADNSGATPQKGRTK
jgi:hypothetical protein